MKIFLKYSILLLYTTITLQHSNSSSLNYIGGVVEYSPVYEVEDGTNTGNINTENYLKFIQKAFEYSVDILVFPESSLSLSSSQNKTVRRSEAASYIPDPKNKIVPCMHKNKYAYSLTSISCAALKYKMYIVINHREKYDCNENNCSVDGLLIYNTNIVFDRNGQVIAKYRKYNLFGEFDTNKTSKSILSTFETDFGVTFGQIICFDIMFETPTLTLVRDMGIKDIVFSSHWFSETPYLYSAQVQAGWSYINDVNLLASGHSNPATASGGSGIYIGRNGYVDVISENRASNILFISEIPKIINGKRLLNINKKNVKIYNFSQLEINTTETNESKIDLHIIDNLDPYTTELINMKLNMYNKTICDRNLCCDFELKFHFNESSTANNFNYYRYRLAVFNGTRSFTGMATGGVNVCGIISCINNTVKSCGKFFESGIEIKPSMTFEYINISMKSDNTQNNLFMPVSFTKNKIPLNATDYYFETVNFKNSSTYNMNLKKPINDLITFAIYGRNFAMDSTKVTISTLK